MYNNLYVCVKLPSGPATELRSRWLSRIIHQSSAGGTLRDGARELAVPAGLGDLAGFIDPHNRPFEYFRFCFAFVILYLAERPLEGPTSERISWTGSVAGHVAAIARVEVERTGWL